MPFKASFLDESILIKGSELQSEGIMKAIVSHEHIQERGIFRFLYHLGNGQHRQLFSRKSPNPYCVQEMGVQQWVKVTWSLLFLNSPSHEEDTKGKR